MRKWRGCARLPTRRLERTRMSSIEVLCDRTFECAGNLDDAVAAQSVKFVRGDAEASQDFGGVFAELGDVRRDFVAAQAGHFDGGTEHLDVVVIRDGATADDMAGGQFWVGGDFVDFAHWSARDIVGEEEGDEVVPLGGG